MIIIEVNLIIVSNGRMNLNLPLKMEEWTVTGIISLIDWNIHSDAVRIHSKFLPVSIHQTKFHSRIKQRFCREHLKNEREKSVRHPRVKYCQALQMFSSLTGRSTNTQLTRYTFWKHAVYGGFRLTDKEKSLESTEVSPLLSVSLTLSLLQASTFPSRRGLNNGNWQRFHLGNNQ